MAAPLYLVLLNAGKSERITEEKRRLIAKVYPTNLTLSSVKFITPFM